MAPVDELAAIGRAYIEAIDARAWVAVGELWQPGAIDHFVGIAELRAPDEVTAFFTGVVAAVPDMTIEIRSVTAQDDRVVVHWRMRGTFDGTGTLLGVAPNGRRLDLLGTDVLVIGDGRIVANTAIVNGLEFARQLAVLPPAESLAERVLFGVVNAAAPLARRLRARRADA